MLDPLPMSLAFGLKRFRPLRGDSMRRRSPAASSCLISNIASRGKSRKPFRGRNGSQSEVQRRSVLFTVLQLVSKPFFLWNAYSVFKRVALRPPWPTWLSSSDFKLPIITTLLKRAIYYRVHVNLKTILPNQLSENLKDFWA